MFVGEAQEVARAGFSTFAGDGFVVGSSRFRVRGHTSVCVHAHAEELDETNGRVDYDVSTT